MSPVVFGWVAGLVVASPFLLIVVGIRRHSNPPGTTGHARLKTGEVIDAEVVSWTWWGQVEVRRLNTDAGGVYRVDGKRFKQAWVKPSKGAR